MVGKTATPPPEWRAAFLDALARGVSVKEAARAVGVGVENAYATRKRNAAFRADWAAVTSQAQARLARGETPRLHAHEVVRASRHGRPRIERAGPGRWSVEKERIFLQSLAETGNVSAAARVTGLSPAALYKRRHQWTGFRKLWDAALKDGWSRTEELLIRAANATLAEAAGERPVSGNIGGGDGEVFAGPRMTVDQAITVWGMHRRAATGEGRPPRHDWRREEPPIEQVRAEIMRRIVAMGG